jgi:hypothetical protein
LIKRSDRCDVREGKTVKKKTSKKKRAEPAARKKKARAKKTATAGSRRTRSSAPRWIGKIEELGGELNLGRSRIFQLRKEPDPLPQVKPGLYDIVKCLRWYVRYLQKKIIARAFPDDGDAGGLATAASATRHKMLSIEVEMKQLELAEKREQVVSIEKVQKDMEAIVVEIRTRILALPPRLAAEILGETDLAVSQVKIERTLKGALMALSQFDPDDVEAVAPASTARARPQ